MLQQLHTGTKTYTPDVLYRIVDGRMDYDQ